jgi:hypothetical protein
LIRLLISPWDHLSFTYRESSRHSALLLPHSPSAGALDDLHSFDPVTMAWTPLPAVGSPSARYAQGFTSAEGKLYVHGGYNDYGDVCALGTRSLCALDAVQVAAEHLLARQVRVWDVFD